jgi:chromosome partitioning protein
MKVTLCSYKGGVSKTVSAVHLAAYMQSKGKTLLMDGDPNRSASEWGRAGKLPFTVVDAEEASRDLVRSYEHLVIDTQARPSDEEMADLVAGCDLLILPTTPDVLSLRALMLTVKTLKQLGADNYRVLITIIPPKPNRDGDESREELKRLKIPVFRHGIRRFSAFQKAALAGVLVNQAGDPRGALGWQDYTDVGKEMMK